MKLIRRFGSIGLQLICSARSGRSKTNPFIPSYVSRSKTYSVLQIRVQRNYLTCRVKFRGKSGDSRARDCTCTMTWAPYYHRKVRPRPCMNEIRTRYLQILNLSRAPIPLYYLSRSCFLRLFLPVITPTITRSIIRTSDNRPPTIDFRDETAQRSPKSPFLLHPSHIYRIDG